MAADRLARVETALLILIERELAKPADPGPDQEVLEIVKSEITHAKKRGELNFVVRGAEGT